MAYFPSVSDVASVLDVPSTFSSVSDAASVLDVLSAVPSVSDAASLLDVPSVLDVERVFIRRCVLVGRSVLIRR